MIEAFTRYLVEKASVKPETARLLTANLKTAAVEKGEILLDQGSFCTHTFFVSSGLLRSYTIDENGKEHIIQFAPEDWLITDRTSVFFQAPSEMNIDAVEASEIVFIDGDLVERLSDLSGEYRRFNTFSLHNHIRSLQHRVAMLLGASAEERYLEFIELYPKIPLRVPQWMIASYLGITPESLSRVRKELARKNFKGGKIER